MDSVQRHMYWLQYRHVDSSCTMTVNRVVSRYDNTSVISRPLSFNLILSLLYVPSVLEILNLFRSHFLFKLQTAMAETGLLTRFVPAKLKTSALYRWWLRFTRVFQFLSAVISLGIFSSRVYKVYRLVNSVKAQRGLDHASGAIEGILAAAVLYTIIATLMICVLRDGGPTWLRWLWVLLDLGFVGAFIAVSVLTSPNGGAAGPRHCYVERMAQGTGSVGSGSTANSNAQSCNLPWGTFILAIIST